MSADWKLTTLKEAGVALIDCDHKTPAAQTEGLPYVGIPQVKDGRITLDGVRLISSEDFIHWRRKAKPSPNDVILSRRCNPGEAAYVPDGLEIALGQNLVLLRSSGTHIYPPLLRWLTRGPFWWEQVNKFINVGAVFNSLKCADIPNFEILLPPLETQIKIAKTLNDLDKKIEINTQTNQTLESIAQAIFKSWFVDFEPVKAKMAVLESGGTREQAELAAMGVISGKSETELAQLQQQNPEHYQQLTETAALFPSAMVESELGEIPEGWEVMSLYETAEYINGGAFKTEHFSQDQTGIPIIKIAELKQGITESTKFTHSDFNKKIRIDNGDVLYSWSGSPETSLEVFKWFGGQGWLNQHIFKLNFQSENQKYFTFYLLKFLKPVLIETAKQKQTTGLGHITVADMKRIQTVSPSNLVLEKFCEVISSIFNKSSSIDMENIRLSKLRDSLLPKLLSGEIDLTNLQSEVA